MKIKPRTHPILSFLALCALLAGCGRTPPAPPVESQPAEASVPAATQAAPAEPSATLPTAVSPTQPPAALEPTGGPGSFNLPDPAAGLEALPRYHAVLRLSFNGTKDGQPYQTEKTYDLALDRDLPARLLTESSGDPSGALFYGLVGSVRYSRPAPDQPCKAGQAAAEQDNVFEPAALLPHVKGAEEAGQETLGAVATTVYTFDGRALAVGEDAAASGKVWVAASGGWVAKYELTLQSDVVFGAGISGEQRWEYELSEAGSAQVVLPEGCAAPLAGLPLPADAAGVNRFPGIVEYATAMSAGELAAFYERELTGQGWLRQGGEMPVSGGVRWLYSKVDETGMEQVLVITARPQGSGSQVTLAQIGTEVPPPQN